jgi:hypothetical protein
MNGKGGKKEREKGRGKTVIRDGIRRSKKGN